MGEVLGCVHKGVVVWGHDLGAEDLGVTMLLTVGAMKFRTLVVGVAWCMLSAGGATIMETIGVEVVSGPAYVAPSWNIWT